MPHKPQRSLLRMLKPIRLQKWKLFSPRAGEALSWAGRGRLSAVASCQTGIGTLDLIGLSNHNESQGGNLSFSSHQRARIMEVNQQNIQGCQKYIPFRLQMSFVTTLEGEVDHFQVEITREKS